MALPPILDLPTVRALYAASSFGPAGLIEALSARIDDADPAVFISRPSWHELARAVEALLKRAPQANSLPLWGVPFAVKDNIDVAALPTTAACPAFEHMADSDAFVVSRLKEAGAIVIGKANLDQFATGLNGTRSPYGIPRSVFDPSHISGGSSSGSAVAVAAGLCSFALGTDTAGSGRVPAAFNNIVGIKPSPGLLSASGVVPACRSLDCVSIFTASVADGAEVRRIAEGFDAGDPYSRRATPTALPSEGLRVGVLSLPDREFFGDEATAGLYDRAIDQIVAMGAVAVPIDFAPFRETAALLYDGPWVAERLVAFEHAGVPWDALDPAVAAVLAGARGLNAVDAFEGFHALEDLKRRTLRQWEDMDVLLLPTVATTYTVEAMLADPLRLNSRLGLYTNFFNLLGLCGIAIPAGFRPNGLPAGITLAAPCFADDALVPLAARLHGLIGEGMGRDRAAQIPNILPPLGSGRLHLAVVGAHLSGMALNHELKEAGAVLERTCRTAADYRLFLLSGTNPAKPGLMRQNGFAGPGMEVEIWSFDPAVFGRFVEAIPSPLGIGKIMLEDGGAVSGFLCEADALEGAEEITRFGGWRAYRAGTGK